ncbi:MAG: hypothetical protein KIT09_31910 [Bryobacteraceae bacterium]|nr:hypothetical protein [Bryobacteraceae bacterium]
MKMNDEVVAAADHGRVFRTGTHNLGTVLLQQVDRFVLERQLNALIRTAKKHSAHGGPHCRETCEILVAEAHRLVSAYGERWQIPAAQLRARFAGLAALEAQTRRRMPEWAASLLQWLAFAACLGMAAGVAWIAFVVTIGPFR